MENVKIGDIVYFKESWSGMIERATVTGIDVTDEPNPRPYANLKCDIGTTNRLLNDLYPTKEACRQAMIAKSNANIKAICDKIKDIPTLIAYMYNHTISTGAEEYTNWDGRKAVAIRAKELLGIDLNSDPNLTRI